MEWLEETINDSIGLILKFKSNIANLWIDKQMILCMFIP